MSVWQPIETAPKAVSKFEEGDWVLLFWPSRGVWGHIVLGRHRYNHRTETYYYTDTHEYDDYELADEPPTHWMPLPDPPVGSGTALPQRKRA